MTSILSAILAISLAILMAASGLILVYRVIRRTDPFDLVCLALWSLALPVVISLCFLAIHS